jgi:hypothetical protein
MTRSGVSSKLANPTWAAFRRHCHRFLAIGYRQALPRIQSEPDQETDITGYICEAIDDWFREHSEESFLFFIKDDPPLRGGGRTGKRRLKSDIIISYAAGKRPEFFVEAKRLHRTKAIASRYIDEAGMGRFISGRYASHCHEVAMIGYVQSDTPESWQATLQSNVEQQRNDLQLDRIIKSVNFEESFPLEWISYHRRYSLPALSLFHIVLDCRKNQESA